VTSRIRSLAAALSLTVALSGSVAAVASPAQAAPKKGCYVTAKAATIRSKPKTSSTAVGIAYRNQTCKELDWAYPKGSYTWTKVKMTKTKKVGWIRDDLLHTAAEDVHTCIPEYC
jgi:hypothetical protein